MARVKKVINNLEVKGTANVFRYNAKYEGLIDGNSVQIPFLAEYKGKRFTKVEYIWHNKGKNGELIKRGIEVSADGELGVPTTYEYNVLCALQRIFIRNKTENGVCELQKENYDDDYLDIDFNITELGREMGLHKSLSNYTRNKIKNSLKILISTTITSTQKGGLYDINKKGYIINNEKNFHLLESCESTEIKDQDSDEVIKDVTKIRLSKFIYNQMVNNYKLIYNNNIVLKTKNPSAIKLYHQLLQLAGSNKVAYANIETLIEKNPSKNKQLKKQKEYIKKLLKIINDNKMANIKYDKDVVIVNFKSDTQIKDLKMNDRVQDRYNTFAAIKEKFFELGFDIVETQNILDNNIQDIRYIQALLRFYDVRSLYENIEKPKNYIMNYIENRHEIDDKYYNKN